MFVKNGHIWACDIASVQEYCNTMSHNIKTEDMELDQTELDLLLPPPMTYEEFISTLDETPADGSDEPIPSVGSDDIFPSDGILLDGDDYWHLSELFTPLDGIEELDEGNSGPPYPEQEEMMALSGECFCGNTACSIYPHCYTGNGIW